MEATSQRMEAGPLHGTCSLHASAPERTQSDASPYPSRPFQGQRLVGHACSLTPPLSVAMLSHTPHRCAPTGHHSSHLGSSALLAAGRHCPSRTTMHHRGTIHHASPSMANRASLLTIRAALLAVTGASGGAAL